MAASSVVSSKGQLVIPARFREELGLKPGVRVVISRQGRGLLIEPNRLEDVLALCGKFAGLPLQVDLAQDRKEWDKRLEQM